jgi:hypothetical protein
MVKITTEITTRSGTVVARRQYRLVGCRDRHGSQVGAVLEAPLMISIRKPIVLRKLLVGLAVAVFSVSATAIPAQASTIGGGGGASCAAWIVSVTKPTTTTIKVTVTVQCDAYHPGAWQITPFIQRNSPYKQVMPGQNTCGGTLSCTHSATFTSDAAGAQSYTIGFDPSYQGTYVGGSTRTCANKLIACYPAMYNYSL